MRKKIALLITCYISFTALGACTTGGTVNTPSEGGDGGKKDNSYSAPVEISSRNIESFETTFYLKDDLRDENSGTYIFKIFKNENGEYVLSEEARYKISDTVGKEVLDKLQTIIEDNDLAALNGTVEETKGLPEEFGPCEMSVTYDSGEKLYFLTDNNPYAKWAAEIKELFVNEFINLGYEGLLSNEEEGALVRFDMGYIDGDSEYFYGAIFTEEDTGDYSVHYMKNVYNRVTKETVVEEIIEVPENFYEELNNVITELKLEDIWNGQIDPGGKSAMDKYAYYTTETESGFQINAFYEGDEAEELCELLKKIAEYLDTFF